MSSSNAQNTNGVFGNSLIDDATLVTPLTESLKPLDIKPAESNTQNYDPFAPLNDKSTDSNTNSKLNVAKPLEQPSVFNQPNIFPVVTQPTSTNNNKNTDVLTGSQKNALLSGATSTDPLTGNSNNSALRTTSTTIRDSTTNIPNFAIRTEGTISMNGGGDYDGNPTDLSDDALIYAAKGFTINGNPTLPVQRDANGNPVRDSSGKLVLVDKAVAVSSGYNVTNGPSNQYAGLIPPPVIPQQTVTVPVHADLRQQELNKRVPQGSPTVTFNSSQNPINNANDWNTKFPSPGTANNPKVVRVTGGGLNIPSNITLNNYVITVDSGDINFNGNNHNFNNVVLITNNGNINLGNVQSRDLAVFASGSINMNGGARFAGSTMLASGSNNGTINFNGATTSINPTDTLRVVSQGDITYNGSSNTRGFLLSAKNFTYNGNSTLYGTIGAKGNIIFNGPATVIYTADIPPDTTPPVISASLEQDTARNNTTNTDKITSNPTTIVSVTDASAIVELFARFNNNSNDTSILTLRDASGNLRLTRTQLEQINGGALPDGTHTLKITAKDASLNASNYEFTFTLDTTEPAPTNLDLTSLTDSGRSDSDNITNNTTPTITGNALAGANVQLFNSGQVIGQATADSTGKWQITSSTLTNGSYTLTATASDIAGNTSAVSQPLQIIIDTLAPTPPSNLKLTTATDTGTSNSDGITKNTNPTITGSAEANSIVKLYKDGLIIGQTTATANGEWSVQLANLSNGQHVFTATATDVAGNVSSPSTQYTITVDTGTPAPTLNLEATSDTGISNSDKITNDNTPTIIGTAEALSTVQLYNGSQLVGETTANNSGVWQITTSELTDGVKQFSATVTDIAGNTNTGTLLLVTVDTTTPQPIFNLDTASDSGEIGDRKTKFDSVTLVGTAEANATIILEQTGTTVIADNTGKFTFNNVSLVIGSNSFTISSTDIAGNRQTYTTYITRLSPPTAINLVGNTIAENSPNGKLIGQFNSIDPDTNNTYTYTLVDNAGGRFKIVDNQLQVANGTLLNYESNTQHTITVLSTATSGLSKTETFTINVTNVNEAPSFTSTPITSTSDATYTYNIITTDPDTNDTLTISATNLPNWLTLTDNGDGTATLTGSSSNILSDTNINLTVTDALGLTATQGFTITPSNRLVEGSNFTATRTIQLTIPATPSILTFKIDPIFDNFDTDSINDAFEVALVDVNGNSLVHTIAKGRDAFFNLTEGENAANGAGATYDATTKTISLNLTGVKAGNANLIFRLVNNDSDTTTNVKITDFAITAAPAGTTAPTQTTFTPEIRSIAAPNFNVLVDVSNSLVASYNRTSFNAETKTLYADISIRNTGSYSVDVPVLVAVTNISDPSVLLRNPDGVTPSGIPYYDFTSLVEKGKLNLDGESGERALAFYNPNNVQFTYDVVVLAQLNNLPVIDSKPVIEIIAGQQYKYSVLASDPNGDSVTYKLLTSPEGMTIEENTGLITWNTLSTNKGNQSVVVEVSDGRGGIATQDYILSVIEAPPNRPPVFITNPKTDGRINTQYTYTARATDADNDNLTYSLVEAPTGMTVDSSTGVVSWKPNGNQLGTYDVILAVSDAKGGTAQQTFKVQTQIEQGNNAPIIISDPVTKVYNPTSAFDGVVFGLKSEYPGGSTLSHPPTKLFSFDVSGSNFRDIGAVTINEELVDADGLAISEKYGLLGFALSEAGSTLISINPETATATVVGTTLVGRQIRGAVFDNDDNLWVVDSSSSKLLNLNPTSGSILKSVPLTLDGQNFRLSDGTDIAIDGQGQFYLTAYPDNYLGSVIYTLDPTTGALTPQKLDSWQYLGGITFATSNNSNHLFGYEINYEDEIYSYDVNANYDRTVLFPNIIPEFNAGGGDLAAIVRKPRYSYTVKALDSDNDSLTYELVTAPTLMEINSSTGKITWANPVESAIPYDVTVRVRDGRGGVDTQSFKLDTFNGNVSQIGGQVYVDDGQPLNRLVYFNDFEDPNRSNIEWSNPLLDTTPIGNRNFLGRYGGKLYSENLNQTQLSLNDLPEHETVTVSFKLFVNGSWGGSLGAFAPDTWKLNVAGGPTLLYTTFGSGYPGSGLPFRLPQAYPENFDENNPSFYLYPGGTGAAEFNTLGYYLTDNWGDAVYNLSFTFEHSGGNLALDFIGGTDEDINNESWGLDDVEISVGRKPKTLSNWSVYLDSNNNNIRDVNEISTLTDDKGNYSFIVAPGNYTVATEVQPGWTTVQPTNSNYLLTVNNNQAITNLNFGNRSSVTGSVAPSFLNTPPSKAMVGQKFNYRAVATDLNGDVLSYDLVVKPSGMVIDSNTGLVSWLPQTDQVGMQNIIVRVLDSNGNVTLQPFQVEVSPFNTAPKFTNNLIANNFEDLIAGVGQALNYQFTAIDAEGDPITYSLKQKPLGVTLDPNTGILSWAPSDSQIGLNNLLVTASDGKGGETTIPFDIRVISSLPNSNPVISSTPRQTIAFGQNYFYSVIANDPNFDPLIISLENAPTGMIIDNQGRIFWNANKLGSNPVTIKVDDGRGGVTRQSFNIDVVSTTAKLNSAPTITSVPDTVVTNVGREYRYNLTGTDPDNDLLLWSLDAAPQGMIIDATTGALVWEPTANQIGEHTVAVRLTDALGQYVGTEFNLTVTGVNAAPQIVSTPITIAAQNQQYTYTVVATDPENDALTYSLDSTSLTKGITIDSNGRIVWTPVANQVGSHAVTVTVSDAFGASNTQAYTIEVGTTAINNAPTITSTPKYVASVGSPYSYQVVAYDPDASDTLTYQILSKPSGVDIQINPTTGLLTWASPTTGTYKIVVGAVDAGGLGAAQGFTLTARNNSNPVISSNAPTTVTPGSTYAYDVKAIDADGDNLTYSLDSISLGKGMTVDALGRLRWAPTITNAGNHAINLTVSDGNGGSATQTINLNVAQDTEAPKVRLIALNNTANLGDNITFQARATDNVKVASLQLLVDGTPVILDANGIVTVKASGTKVSAVAIATDTSGNTKQETFDVTVNDPSNTNPPTVSLQALTANDGFITAPTTIRGTISDDGNLSYYKLLVAPVWAVDNDNDSDEFTLIKRIDNPTAITNGILGTLDPSLLQNDTYVVRLEVADSGGNTSYTDQTVDVTGDLKLGNFRLSFTDLTVPVTGIPITLTRTYDTLTSGTIDDFGYGWRMEFRDTDLRTSLGKPSEEDDILGYQRAFKDGTKVYITLPGGKREAFTFKPTPDRIFKIAAGLAGGNDSLVYNPSFVADKGVTSTLTVKDARILRRDGSSEYVGLNAGLPYNPADSNFGGIYVLTTKEGTVYEIDALTGDLLTVTDTEGNKLTYTDAEISSSTGQKITFERDTQNRITAVKDPMGYLIQYDYDSKGDLISVTDREGNVTRMEYNQERPHYLDKIIDPLGRTGVRNEYGDDGRLKKIVDVNGKPVEMTYDLDASEQKVTDQLGNVTTYVYDARGNVVTEIDALGKITKRRYNDDNDVLEQTIISDRSGVDGFTKKYTYDNFGNMLTEEDPLSNVTYYTYGQYGRLLTEVDPLGNTTAYTYSPKGRLRSMTDASGNITKYGYDLKGNLTEIVNANGDKTGFRYDTEGNITSAIDAQNNEIIYTYNANGKRFSETQTVTTPQGLQQLVSELTYDREGRVKSVKDPLQNVTKYEYDDNGNQIAVINARQNKTEYRYNSKGQLVETIDPDNTENNPLDNPRTITIYDEGGRSRATIDQNGKVTHYEYDALSRVTKIIYPSATENTLAQLIAAIAPGQTLDSIDWTKVVYPKNSPAYLVNNPYSSTEYYTDGLVKAEIDERGNRTEYRYNALGQLIETIYPDKTPQSLSDNPRTRNEYDKARRLISTTDALGRTTTFIYDQLGRLKQTNYSDGTSTTTTFDALGRVIARTDKAGRTTKYKYNSVGKLIETIYPDDTPGSDEDNPKTRNEYDELGRKIAFIDERLYRTEYEYDKASRQTLVRDALGNETTYTYNSVGNLLTKTDALNHTTSYVYDSQERLVETHFADRTYTTTTYDLNGQVIAETDQNNQTTRYEYDSIGRLTAVVDAKQQRTEYKYDLAGNLISAKDANGHATTYEYDERNRRIATVLPLLQRSETTYDAVGNVVKQKDFNQNTINYRYDDNNRVIAKEFLDGTSVIYTYTKTGQVETVTDSRGTTTYKYDLRNRLISRTDPSGQYLDTGATIEYEYDAAGNRTRVQTKAGTTKHTYDSLNRLKTVTKDTDTTTYFYDAVGNLWRTKLSNNIVETRQYDQLNRLVSLKNTLTNPVSGVEAVISGYDYTLNPVGYRLEVEEHNGRKVKYEYDELYRLLSEKITDPSDSINNGRTISYTYDNVGNRLTRNDSIEGLTTYYYNNNDLLLNETQLKNGQTVYTYNYTYDNNGNTISRAKNGNNETIYTWDFENRLIGVDNLLDGKQVDYVYDSKGIRVSSTSDGITTNYLVDTNLPHAQVLAEYDSNGNLKTDYLYGHDLISQTKEGQQSFYLVDGLGSTRVLTDVQASITDTYTYDAFGKLISSSGSTDNNYLFTGEQYDENLEQYYLRQRYYDSNTGRFTRRDVYEGRLEEPLTLHKYLYANGNPVNLIDPSGLSAMAGMFSDASWGIPIVLGIMAVLGAVRALEMRIELGSYTPEPLKGFNEDSPKLGVSDNTARKPEQTLVRGILGRVGGHGGFNEGTNLSVPGHTGHSGLADTMRNLLTNVFYIDPLDTNLDLPEIKKITGRVNDIGACDVLAGQIEDYFIEEGIPQSGQHIRLDTGFSSGEGAYILDRTTGDVIGLSGYHEGIIVNINGQQVVFDTLNPNGQPLETWLERFYTYGSDINVVESSLGDRIPLEEYTIPNNSQ